MPMNGAASSGQCREYTRAPMDPAANPAIPPVRRNRVGASPLRAPINAKKTGVATMAMRKGQTRAVRPKISNARPGGGVLNSTTPASAHMAITGSAMPTGIKPRGRPGRAKRALPMSPTMPRDAQNASRTQNMGSDNSRGSAGFNFNEVAITTSAAKLPPPTAKR